MVWDGEEIDCGKKKLSCMWFFLYRGEPFTAFFQKQSKKIKTVKKKNSSDIYRRKDSVDNCGLRNRPLDNLVKKKYLFESFFFQFVKRNVKKRVPL